MNILLVLPAGKQFRVESPTAKVPRRKYLRFSLLPLTIVAALTPQEFDVTIIDENVEYLDLTRSFDLVGITFMTALAPRAYAIASAFRQQGIPVIAGGYHPTLCPDEVAEHFDAVVVGEAESHWKTVLADWQMGSLKKIYTTDKLCHPKEIPIPRRELTNRIAKEYVTVNAVQTGRGCRNTCRYCSITAFHRNSHRSRPLDNVLDELEQLPRNIMFIDDNIITNRVYARELFKRMIPLRKRWVGQSSIDLADDPELLALAKMAGCIGLFIGIESLDEQNMGQFDKSFNKPKNYKKQLSLIHRTGILVFASMMVGGENDTVQSFQNIWKFLQHINADGLQLNIMTPLPGTPLFKQFHDAGRIWDYDWSNYDFRHVVIEPKLMSRGELQRGADWLYLQFYRFDRICLRAVKTLLQHGWLTAFIVFRLGFTYRYDNRHEKLAKRLYSREELHGGVSIQAENLINYQKA